MIGRGFVDVQLNGFMGINFSEAGLTLDQVRRVTLDVADKGTVAYCPTVCTGSMEMYEENLAVLAKAMKDPDLSGHLLGIHIEGPFISPKPGAVGAHNVDYVRPPSIEDFDKFQKWSEGNVSILTLAPEMPDAAELTKHAADQGVIVMLGHHFADDEFLEKAVAAGAKGSTHLGNGLPNEINRHRNPLWWQLACDSLWATLITDGHHLPAPFIKTALRAKTLDRSIVISDAASLAGMPAGVYGDFGKKVEIEPSGRIVVYGTPYLAGSHSTMIECMNFLASLKLLSEEEMWQVSLVNPLRLLGMETASLEGVPCRTVTFDGEQFNLAG